MLTFHLPHEKCITLFLLRALLFYAINLIFVKLQLICIFVETKNLNFSLIQLNQHYHLQAYLLSCDCAIT